MRISCIMLLNCFGNLLWLAVICFTKKRDIVVVRPYVDSFLDTFANDRAQNTAKDPCYISFVLNVVEKFVFCSVLAQLRAIFVRP
jgi:hypothetical protein